LKFNNDFKEIFPEIFSPYKRRYDFELGNNIIDEYNKLIKKDELNITNLRKNKKMLEKKHIIGNLENINNFNKRI